jgi:2-keto-4-pentenoate hydratase/2-oxohepta-3-ene-1,7-dioic acid hydratase in catechol pathway
MTDVISRAPYPVLPIFEGSQGAVFPVRRIDASAPISALGHMLWSVPEIIAQRSLAWTLAPGDLIFTGTPSGVGPVGVGDRLYASIAGVGTLSVQIAAPQ